MYCFLLESLTPCKSLHCHGEFYGRVKVSSFYVTHCHSQIDITVQQSSALLDFGCDMDMGEFDHTNRHELLGIPKVGLLNSPFPCKRCQPSKTA